MSVTLLIMLSSLIKVKHEVTQIMRGLRYPWLILERLGFPLALTQILQVLASSCLPEQILNFPVSNLLAYFDEKAQEFT